MSASAFSRRTLLAGTGSTALLLGTGGLSACSSGPKGPGNTATANSSVALPTYVAYTGLKPDLPGTKEGVDPAFRNFPKDNPKSVPEMPGKGETLTAMANIYYAVPPGPDQNSYWAGLNKRMGIDLKLQMVSNADYIQKFATTIAGNELPDLLQTPNGSPPPVPNLPQLLEKRFTNLTRAPLRRRDQGVSQPGQRPHPHLEVVGLQRRHLRHPDPARGDRQLPLHSPGLVRGGRGLSGAQELRGAGRDHQSSHRSEEAALGLQPGQPASTAARPDERRAQRLA